jgi:sialic acid synthase SpsE
LEVRFNIENRAIGPLAPVFVIAEIGINHDGDPEEAKWLVDSAAEAGADAVKFQTVVPDVSYAKGSASHREFSGRTLNSGVYRELMQRARERGIVMFSTPGDLPSLELMLQLGMPCIKISSSQLTNVSILRAAARSGVPLLISTGMADLDETRQAVNCAVESGAKELALLHCTSLYPAPEETLNLRAMASLRAEFDVPVGYSDHYLGDLAAVAAVAAGACIIEKHFTRDQTRAGADHAISLEPAAFAAMTERIRKVERMLGSSIKEPVAAERRLVGERRRYLVAARPIKAGEIVKEDAVVAKRLISGVTGVPAEKIDLVLGRRLRRAITADDVIREDDLEALR